MILKLESIMYKWISGFDLNNYPIGFGSDVTVIFSSPLKSQNKLECLSLAKSFTSCLVYQRPGANTCGEHGKDAPLR